MTTPRPRPPAGATRPRVRSSRRGKAPARRRSRWVEAQRSWRLHWQLYLLVIVPLAYFVIFKYIPIEQRRHRVQGLQRHPGALGQRLGRVQELRAVLQQPGLRHAAEEHLHSGVLPGAGELPDPDHPGHRAERDPQRLVQAHGADGHLRALLHLHRRGGLDDDPRAVARARHRERRARAVRDRADQLPRRSETTSGTSTSGPTSGRRRVTRPSSTWPRSPASIRRCTSRPRSTVPAGCSGSGTSTCRASCPPR